MLMDEVLSLMYLKVTSQYTGRHRQGVTQQHVQASKSPGTPQDTEGVRGDGVESRVLSSAILTEFS